MKLADSVSSQGQSETGLWHIPSTVVREECSRQGCLTTALTHTFNQSVGAMFSLRHDWLQLMVCCIGGRVAMKQGTGANIVLDLLLAMSTVQGANTVLMKQGTHTVSTVQGTNRVPDLLLAVITVQIHQDANTLLALLLANTVQIHQVVSTLLALLFAVITVQGANTVRALLLANTVQIHQVVSTLLMNQGTHMVSTVQIHQGANTVLALQGVNSSLDQFHQVVSTVLDLQVGARRVQMLECDGHLARSPSGSR